MWICIAPSIIPLRHSGMASVLKGSHSFTCTPRVHPLTEPYLPLPSQPKLVLIDRSRRDGRLSWPWVAGWLHTKISKWWLQYPGGPAAESKYCGDESTCDGDDAFFCSLASSSSFFSSPDASVSFCFLRIWKYDTRRWMETRWRHFQSPLTPQGWNWIRDALAIAKLLLPIWDDCIILTVHRTMLVQNISVHTSSTTTLWRLLESGQALATKCSPSPDHNYPLTDFISRYLFKQSINKIRILLNRPSAHHVKYY